MFTALLSFLGGTAFRMLWGDISTWLTKKQEHAQELDRMQLQGQLDAAQHARNLEAIKMQAEQGIKVIEAQASAAVGQVEAEAWLQAVKATNTRTGVKWVDAWNAMIRPGGATWGVIMLTVSELGLLAAPLSEGTSSVIFAFLGLFVADRTLGKRGR